jgi:DNA-binding NtrC family response regulator
MQYAWPGNLRELHNEVKRYLVLGESTSTARPSLGSDEKAVALHGTHVNTEGTLKQMIRDLKGKAEEEAIRKALEQTQWRRKDAAALLGICYKALIYKSRQYGILRPSVRAKRKLPKAAEGPVEMSFAAAAGANGNGIRLSALKAVEMKDGGDRR